MFSSMTVSERPYKQLTYTQPLDRSWGALMVELGEGLKKVKGGNP